MTYGDSAPGSQLVAWDARFWSLIDPEAQLEVLATKNFSFAVEGPAWLPETNQAGGGRAAMLPHAASGCMRGLMDAGSWCPTSSQDDRPTSSCSLW